MELRTTGASAGAGRVRAGRRGRVLVAVGIAVGGLVITSGNGHADGVDAKARLQDASGNVVGIVRFSGEDAGKTLVRAELASALAPGFHGFHVHANGSGAGCVADPSGPASTWFTSVGGHHKHGTEAHGEHAGDLPSLLVHDDGTAQLRFTTDRIDLQELDGKALIVHAKPDNFGNVPVGSGANQYTPNSASATTLTANTGNAGDRLACGVIELR